MSIFCSEKARIAGLELDASARHHFVVGGIQAGSAHGTKGAGCRRVREARGEELIDSRERRFCRRWLWQISQVVLSSPAAHDRGSKSAAGGAGAVKANE